MTPAAGFRVYPPEDTASLFIAQPRDACSDAGTGCSPSACSRPNSLTDRRGRVFAPVPALIMGGKCHLAGVMPTGFPPVISCRRVKA